MLLKRPGESKKSKTPLPIEDWDELCDEQGGHKGLAAALAAAYFFEKELQVSSTVLPLGEHCGWLGAK